MAIGAEAVETADPADERPVRASAGPARRDVVDAVPKERRNGLTQVATQGRAKRAGPALPRDGEIAGAIQRGARVGALGAPEARPGARQSETGGQQAQHYVARAVRS